MDGEGWEWDRKEARKLIAACVTFSKLSSSLIVQFEFHVLGAAPERTASLCKKGWMEDLRDSGDEREWGQEEGRGDDALLCRTVWTLTPLPPNLQLLIPQS